ncbi:sce7726 family protein [Candidatus Palauibacter sp.]|uniref:sce7726 family protein n=1 Tax=Candidatus Palauibacter sp. TaxID=3101350 RepID=UPI003B5CA608
MEAKLRSAVKRQLLQEDICDPQTLVIEELGILQGSVRIDIAVVNGLIHGFELKSSTDTLERLPRQVEAYSRVVDQATLVVADSHLRDSVAILPPWWGIVAVSTRGARLSCRLIREIRPNPNPNSLDIAGLLWRPEALDILEKLGLATGVRSKPRRTLHARLATTLDIDVLRFTVRRCLRQRQAWRPGEPRT